MTKPIRQLADQTKTKLDESEADYVAGRYVSFDSVDKALEHLDGVIADAERQDKKKK